MRNWVALPMLLLVAVAPCKGQHADVSMQAAGPVLKDTRPFGKYLTEICTLGTKEDMTRTVQCARIQAVPPESAQIRFKDQTVTVKVVCDPSKKTACATSTPKAGGDFFVSATASSGLPVLQEVLLGNVTPLGGTNTVKYHVNGDGPILLRASAAARPPYYDASAPVDLALQPAAASASGDDGVCSVLPASAPGTVSMLLDAPTMTGLLGNPTPFLLTAAGPNTIAVYSTREPVTAKENAILQSLQKMMAELAGRTPDSLGITPSQGSPFSVILRIPHASALGDLATRMSSLNFSQFTVQDAGRGSVRVTATSQPDCDNWKGFLTQIRTMVWQLISEPMNKRLFYLSSSDVASAFSGIAPTAGGTSSTTGSATSTATPAATTGGTSTSAPASQSSSASTVSTATISIAQPPGSNIEINSDTTPCVVAGLALGNSTGCGSSQTPSSTSSTSSATSPSSLGTTSPAPTPLAMASVSVAAGTGEQTPPDLLVYSDENPGDDAQIAERNRILAQLDLPRPEMILNAWVTQDSSASQETTGAFTNAVTDAVASYNQEFESVVWKGWANLKQQAAAPGFYNEPFRSYLADRFVADTAGQTTTGKTAQEMSQSFLDHSQAKMADPIAPLKRTSYGICERGWYCLGYADLFNPVKPVLTDLLLVIFAAQEPVNAAAAAAHKVEGDAPPVATNFTCSTQSDPLVRKRCDGIWQNVAVSLPSLPMQPEDCAAHDLRGIMGSLLFTGEPTVHLRCFMEEATKLLAGSGGAGEAAPYGVGLMRSAIADFLFNYKISQQYPHEFSAYDLSHSADVLNNALSPLIDAFNRDLRTYQLFVRADLKDRVETLNRQTDGRCCAKRLFGLDKPTFFNDGVVTVRTIAGQQSQVSTTSQSYLNVSTAPQLSSVLSSLAGLGGSQGGGGGGSSSSASSSGATTTTTTTTTTTSGGSGGGGGGGGGGGSPGPLSALTGIASLLSNYQTTYGQIGRQISFTATPRSLAAASSAEIAVTLNADESTGGPTFTTGGTSSNAFNLSRVASHDTTTRVRVESIKLFEISSFTAIVESSRSRFPLLPPFVEIPYIGTFAGVPLGPAKEFHASSAIISAYVVPTAADIAYGLRFLSDLVTDGVTSGTCSFFGGSAGPDVTQPCVFNKMLSLRDAGPASISQFNKNLIRCFAVDTTSNGCARLSFDTTLKMN